MIKFPYKQFSVICALICIFMGAFYLGRWYFVGSSEFIGISYPGTFSFILIGCGLLSLYSRSHFPLVNFFGACLSLTSLAQIIHGFVFQHEGWREYAFFSSHANPLNLWGFSLFGIVFLCWRKKREYGFYLCNFLVAFICLGMSVLGLFFYVLGFSLVYGNVHLFGLVTLFLASLGFLCSLIYFTKIDQIASYKWMPFSVGMALLNFAMFLTVGLYLNRGIEGALTDVLTGYALLGGVLFSVIASYLVRFWLLSKEQIQTIQNIRKERDLALKSSKTGIWKLDVAKNRVVFDFIACRLFGFNSSSFTGTLEDLLACIYPLDRIHVKNAVDVSIRTGELFEVEHRVVFPSGMIRFLQAKGRVLLNEKGQSSVMTGTVWDITEKKHAEQLLKLSEGFAKALARDVSFSDVANHLLTLFHDFFGWEVLVISRWDPLRKCFNAIAAEPSQSPEFSTFLSAVKTGKLFELGPLVERLSRDLQPIAFGDLGVECKCSRSPIAAQEGIRGALVFPILKGTSIEGVVELFKKEPFTGSIDSGFAGVLTALGVSIFEYMQKKEGEMALRELVKIITCSQEPIYSCTVDGVILSWNGAAEKVFGFGAKEITGKNISVLFPAEHKRDLEKLQESFKAGQDVQRMLSQVKTKEGHLRWVEASYSILPDEQGRGSKIAVMMHDFTEEKVAREALAKAEEKFRSFVESTSDWIWEIDLKGVFTYSNPAVEEVLRYSIENVLGQTIYLILSEESGVEVKKDLDSLVYSKVGWKHLRLVWKDKQGNERILESSALPIFNEKKEVIGFRGVSRDITEKEEMEKRKDEFISMVSHEIRTPLTSIHGALGLLSVEKDFSIKAADLIKLAYRNSELLVHLIQDIIDVEKIQLKQFEFRMEKVSLMEVIKEAMSSTRLLSKEGSVQFIEESMLSDITVFADRDRLMQVLLNILSNAVKFSAQDKKIFISTELFADKVRVSIRDEGPGIPEEFWTKMFGRFEHLHSHNINFPKGTGLGLYISKMIIEKMQGTIGFSSKMGEGSCFYFELPIENKGGI